MTEAELAAEVEHTIAVYEKITGHPATRTHQMIERHGLIKALSRLMASADLQQGFKALRDSGQLSQSFEALVLRHKRLFSPTAVEAAQWRLEHPHELL
jgi:hypothetical protein